jgi:hypothetical protein
LLSLRGREGGKEMGKILALQGKSGDSNQINLDGDNAELRDDARSQLKRNRDQRLFFVKNGPCNTKSLNVTNDENNLALVPMLVPDRK